MRTLVSCATMKPPPVIHPSDTAIALYGGSFDPVHRAHLMVARTVLRDLGLDRVVFIPAAQSPLKETAVRADDASRLHMLELATAGEPGFAVDDCELRRGGRSYTIDTVRAFQTAHPQARLSWIIGADQFACLPRWYAIEALAQLVEFIVLGRPGYTMQPPAVAGLRYQAVEAPLLEQSSSEIRRRIAGGLPLADWLPASVEAFIFEHALYTDRPESCKHDEKDPIT
ncbi:MAG: nicotinate (nicotinamide) nucleotide adenylyltransferase [Puniceicoccaceae bacterium]|nr:MAG: nicotinate (nicotinamide) nucleotide adenylyltransferase [Puniceicoccaceae bacterium]